MHKNWIPPPPVLSQSGNLLSSVPPPSALPNFVSPGPYLDAGPPGELRHEGHANSNTRKRQRKQKKPKINMMAHPGSNGQVFPRRFSSQYRGKNFTNLNQRKRCPPEWGGQPVGWPQSFQEKERRATFPHFDEFDMQPFEQRGLPERNEFHNMNFSFRNDFPEAPVRQVDYTGLFPEDDSSSMLSPEATYHSSLKSPDDKRSQRSDVLGKMQSLQTEDYEWPQSPRRESYGGQISAEREEFIRPQSFGKDIFPPNRISHSPLRDEIRWLGSSHKGMVNKPPSPQRPHLYLKEIFDPLQFSRNEEFGEPSRLGEGFRSQSPGGGKSDQSICRPQFDKQLCNWPGSSENAHFGRPLSPYQPEIYGRATPGHPLRNDNSKQPIEIKGFLSKSNVPFGQRNNDEQLFPEAAEFGRPVLPQFNQFCGQPSVGNVESASWTPIQPAFPEANKFGGPVLSQTNQFRGPPVVTNVESASWTPNQQTSMTVWDVPPSTSHAPNYLKPVKTNKIQNNPFENHDPNQPIEIKEFLSKWGITKPSRTENKIRNKEFKKIGVSSPNMTSAGKSNNNIVQSKKKKNLQPSRNVHLHVALRSLEEPVGALTHQQVELLKGYLFTELDKFLATRPVTPPKFNQLIYQNGLLTIRCEDSQSLAWLKMTVARMPLLWEGPTSQIHVTSYFDRLIGKVRGIVVISHETTPADVIKDRLAAQNSWINVRKWDISNHHVVGFGTSAQSTIVVFRFPESDVQILQNRKCLLHYAFTQVKIKLPKKKLTAKTSKKNKNKVKSNGPVKLTKNKLTAKSAVVASAKNIDGSISYVTDVDLRD